MRKINLILGFLAGGFLIKNALLLLTALFYKLYFSIQPVIKKSRKLSFAGK